MPTSSLLLLENHRLFVRVVGWTETRARATRKRELAMRMTSGATIAVAASERK